MTSLEIEDVLSSIRRLVSDDLRPAPRLSRPTVERVELAAATDPGTGSSSGVGKLLLTPALRVVMYDTEPVYVPPPVPLAARYAAEAGAAAGDADLDALQTGLDAALRAEAERRRLAGWPVVGHVPPEQSDRSATDRARTDRTDTDRTEPDLTGAVMALPAEPFAGIPPGDSDPVEEISARGSDPGTATDQSGPKDDVWTGEGTSGEAASSAFAAARARSDGSQDDLGAKASVQPGAPGEEAIWSRSRAACGVDPTDDGDVAVSRNGADDGTDPRGSSSATDLSGADAATDPAAGKTVAQSADGDSSWDQQGPLDLGAFASVRSAPVRIEETPDRAAWADRAAAEAAAEATAQVDTPRGAERFRVTEPDAFTADDLIDEDMLRSLVRDILREELQGALGVRITSNVRKLVRAEINRALVGRDID